MKEKKSLSVSFTFCIFDRSKKREKVFMGKLLAKDGLHMGAVGLSGFVGGALGWQGLVFELPVTTTLIMRSLLDIAREQGEEISTDSGVVEDCLFIFYHGSQTTKSDDETETGYFASRLVLAESLSREGAKHFARLLAQAAARFSIPISQKTALQLVPVVGGLSGASLNLLFIKHFQTIGRAHFTIKRLEKKYGEALVKRTSLNSKKALKPKSDEKTALKSFKEMSRADLKSLKTAIEDLNSPSFPSKALALLGRPFEAGAKKLPKELSDFIRSVVDESLSLAVRIALKTVK
jgi:hypothetical protein